MGDSIISKTEALSAMRAWICKGDYKQVATYADQLPLEINNCPSVVLEKSRAFLRQGYPLKAEAALTSANLKLATRGEQLILALEAAALLVYRHVAIRQAIEAAHEAFVKAENFSISETDRAEAERIYIRILVTAATYFEINSEDKRKALDKLPSVAQQLELAGRIDEALAARFTYAQQLETPIKCVEALETIASEAILVDRPALAAEAYMISAEYHLAIGAPSDEIHQVLDKAVTFYDKAHHVHGTIDVLRIRSKIAIERELASPDGFEACLEAYQQVEFYRGMLNVLMDLSQLAHDRGDTSIAADYRKQTMVLSEKVGMGLSKDTFRTAQIDLLMRNHDYGAAIELCQSAIASELPVMNKALYEQLLATAYSFIDNLDEACSHGRKAIEIFEAVSAVDAASDAVMKLTSDLNSYRREEAWNEAEILLATWSFKDEKRGDFAAAVSKKEMMAQIKINRYFYSPVNRGDLTLLDEAEEAIAEAEVLTQRLPARESNRRLGNLYQLRGQLYQGRADEDRVIQMWRDALALYKKASFSMETANCHYMLGVLYLNRANQELLPNLAESENNLREALTYYDAAGVRGQAADARFMFAQLYTNASIRVSQDISNQMLDAALGHLAEGEVNYDDIRKEFNAGNSILDVQRGKRLFIQKSQRIYELALDIHCRFCPNPIEAWKWTQRAKARALTDALGMGTVPPARIMSEIESHPNAFQLVRKERELTARINRVYNDLGAI